MAAVDAQQSAITLDVLDTLARMEQAATPFPRYCREMDDDLCMTAIGVSTAPERFSGAGACGRSERDNTQMAAGCLIQSRLSASHSRGRWSEDAALIATMRNHLPELLHLARIGLNNK